jgi:hypothetical protein
MKNKYLKFLLVLVISLLLVACGSDSNDVPSLADTPIPDAVDEALDDEALMMEFTECLRNEGLEVADPKVDANGNIQFPEIIDEKGVSKEEWWGVCGTIIERITFEEKKVDRSSQLEEYFEIATCMSEAGFDIGEPTAETLDTWMDDLKNTFDWDDPDAEEVIDICFGDGSSGSKGGSGK